MLLPALILMPTQILVLPMILKEAGNLVTVLRDERGEGEVPAFIKVSKASRLQLRTKRQLEQRERYSVRKDDT
jgi:hypothetical protein